MSGLAYITGHPDGPPTLPPLGFADAVAGMAGAIAVLNALFHRDARGGDGQVIDLAIVEAILQLMGAQATNYDALGIIQERTGNRSFSSAPRNVYGTKDGKWVALSTSASTIAERVMRLVGRPDYIEKDWFKTGAGRVRHADELDAAVGGWIKQRTQAEVIAAFVAAEAAIATVNNIEDVLNDPQYQARESFLRVQDPELDSVLMPNVPFRMADTPLRIRWGGRPLGADTQEVLSEIGISADEIESLRERGVL
jgi:crotonobetainyl-CoA:carnitine CoA-transferase CaiB-like acyl-CoA transferase